MKVVILCGGKGTRFRERTQDVPKPLIEIGEKPILWHVMKIYACNGFNDFILCLGYKGDLIKQYFMEEKKLNNNQLELSINSPNNTNNAEFLSDWHVTLVDTGLETNTGGRIKKIESYIDSDIFAVTYADGLAKINLKEMVEFHKKHKKIATLLGVKPILQFGILSLDSDDLVTKFVEKPRTDVWINGGFFLFNRDIFRYLDENCILEKTPFETLASRGEVVAHKHSNFWCCMDTYKDYVMLNDMWKFNKAEWRVW